MYVFEQVASSRQPSRQISSHAVNRWQRVFPTALKTSANESIRGLGAYELSYVHHSTNLSLARPLRVEAYEQKRHGIASLQKFLRDHSRSRTKTQAAIFVHTYVSRPTRFSG